AGGWPVHVNDSSFSTIPWNATFSLCNSSVPNTNCTGHSIRVTHCNRLYRSPGPYLSTNVAADSTRGNGKVARKSVSFWPLLRYSCAVASDHSNRLGSDWRRNRSYDRHGGLIATIRAARLSGACAWLYRHFN